MEFLLTLLLIFLIFGLIIRLIPYIFSWWLKRRMGHDKNASSPHTGEKREGTVYISRKDPAQQEKIIEKNVGEYVDYEPVNDKD